MLKLRDWVDINKLDSFLLSKNPNAIELLKKNQNKINWYFLSLNPNAIELLKENKDKINWHALSKNTKAIDLLHLWRFKTPIFYNNLYINYHKNYLILL